MGIPQRPPRRLGNCFIPLSAVAALTSAVVLAPGGSALAAGTASKPNPTIDFATANSGGDTRTAAAIRRNASFVCPATATATIAGAGRPPRPAGSKLVVATTVAPITSIVANIAGDRALVSGVIPEGQDSHTYEPKPSIAKLFSNADVVFLNGLSLEDPTKALAKANLPGTGQLIELGTNTLTPDQYIYDFSFPREGGKPNPHLWTNPPMARCYAVQVAGVLSKADPANAAYYRANAAKLTAKIDDLDRRFAAASQKMAPKNRALLTYHDAYAYFAAHYGWRIIGAIQISDFEDPTPREVAAIIEQVKKEQVPAIFGSEVFPSPVLEQIGRDAGVKYVDQLRDDDLPGEPGQPGHSYLGLMKADFVTMLSSLQGDATALRAFDATDVVKDTAKYPQ